MSSKAKLPIKRMAFATVALFYIADHGVIWAILSPFMAWFMYRYLTPSARLFRGTGYDNFAIIAGFSTLIILGYMVIGDYRTKDTRLQQNVIETSDPVAAEPKPKTQEFVTVDSLYQEFSNIRKSNGLIPTSWDDKLNRSAQSKCDDMIQQNYFGHYNPNTNLSGVEYAKKQYNQKPGLYGENLGRGYGSNLGKPDSNGRVINAEYFYDQWKNSQSHREALTNERFTVTGLAICGNADGREWGDIYVVQHFYGS